MLCLIYMHSPLGAVCPRASCVDTVDFTIFEKSQLAVRLSVHNLNE